MRSHDDADDAGAPLAAGVFISILFAVVVLGEIADCGREPPHHAPRDIETAYAAD